MAFPLRSRMHLRKAVISYICVICTAHNWKCSWMMRPQKIKKGRGVSPLLPVLGNLTWKLSCALVALLAKSKQDITRTGNHYTTLNNLF